MGRRFFDGTLLVRVHLRHRPGVRRVVARCRGHLPVGDKPCEVKEMDVVRITAKGIAGSKIEVAVNGQAKLTKKTKVIERAGNINVVGSRVEEYEIKPTGKGKATVKVTVTPPQPDAKPEVKEYEIVIK
jgi:hypothetical protein